MSSAPSIGPTLTLNPQTRSLCRPDSCQLTVPVGDIAQNKTDLVCGLVQVLCVEGDSETHSHARSQLHIVCQSSNPTVIDLGLIARWVSERMARTVNSSYLSKGCRVHAIFAGNFHANVVTAFRVPSGFRASFDLRADFMIV